MNRGAPQRHADIDKAPFLGHLDLSLSEQKHSL